MIYVFRQLKSTSAGIKKKKSVTGTKQGYACLMGEKMEMVSQ